jgi:hypothetical protein
VDTAKEEDRKRMQETFEGKTMRKTNNKKE